MSGERNCYPGTDVLVNKYNIYNKELLERFEIQKVAVKLLGIDVNPDRIESTFDIEHLVSIHQYLFGDIYEWAGTFRDENFYKSEKVLSGGSAQYAEYWDIVKKLNIFFQKYNSVDWNEVNAIGDVVSQFLSELWSIHPFREGNTRTCVTFLWHYLRGRGVDFRLELLRNNPMYVRDSLVMANYDEDKYLKRIIEDALAEYAIKDNYGNMSDTIGEKYQIAKSDYEAFRDKYSIIK